LLVYPTSVEKLGLSAFAKTQQKRSSPYTDGGVDMFEAPGTTQGFAGTLLQRDAPGYFATPDVHQPDGMFDGTFGDALLRKFAVTLDLRNMTIATQTAKIPVRIYSHRDNERTQFGTVCC
jgi:hypothetical protein